MAMEHHRCHMHHSDVSQPEISEQVLVGILY